ncbi:unnamed protein product [Lasius platythorax]|uniref:Uncharacterized protein n=1 Tax=Lasius platythorax TaxID=488582 RepID=A0AAV2NUN9_9HYME
MSGNLSTISNIGKLFPVGPTNLTYTKHADFQVLAEASRAATNIYGASLLHVVCEYMTSIMCCIIEAANDVADVVDNDDILFIKYDD